MDTNQVNIVFGPNADVSHMSDYSRQVLLELFATTNNPEPHINSTVRSAHDQARAMFGNLELPNGVANNRHLYDPPGQAVINVYVANKEAGKSDDEIKADMEAEINRQGPYHVSHHCSDPAVLQVFDVSLSHLPNPHDFESACENDERVSKSIVEAAFNCYHVEIPQPQ